MLFSSLAVWDEIKHLYPPIFTQALLFLQSQNVYDDKEAFYGRHELNGPDFFVSIEPITPKKQSEALFELHKKYLDIHVVLSGVELQGYDSSVFSGVYVENALDSKDYALLHTQPTAQHILLRPGDFTVFVPDELHQTCCMPEAPVYGIDGAELNAVPLVKAVFKIANTLF